MNTAPIPPAAPPRGGRVIHSKLRLELDVTPRWFAVPAPDKYNAGVVFEDAADILRTLLVAESIVRLLAVDVSVGTTGVRLVLMVPAEQPIDGFEMERQAIVAMLDALDGVHPRRRRVTEGRAKAAAERAAAEQAAVTPPVPAPAPPAPSDAPAPSSSPDVVVEEIEPSSPAAPPAPPEVTAPGGVA